MADHDHGLIGPQIHQARNGVFDPDFHTDHEIRKLGTQPISKVGRRPPTTIWILWRWITISPVRRMPVEHRDQTQRPVCGHRSLHRPVHGGPIVIRPVDADKDRSNPWDPADRVMR
nr:hypothetical protein [Microlunatus sp. Gsoil 973]